jgi:hypothetical protein
MIPRIFTREEIQNHIMERLKRSSLIRPNEFRSDIREVAFQMANAGMINLERGFFNCFGLKR